MTIDNATAHELLEWVHGAIHEARLAYDRDRDELWSDDGHYPATHDEPAGWTETAGAIVDDMDSTFDSAVTRLTAWEDAVAAHVANGGVISPRCLGWLNAQTAALEEVLPSFGAYLFDDII